MRKCYQCKGTGVAYWRVTGWSWRPRPCTVCHGTGKVQPQANKKK